MKSFMRSLLRFLKRDEGVTAVECALMLALIVVVCIVAIHSINPSPAVADQAVVVENLQP